MMARGEVPDSREPRPRRHPWAWLFVAAGLVGVFALDANTGSAPVQHLYYVPIIFAAIRLGRWAGPAVALAAVLLYHLANPALLTAHYRESDLVQILLFLAVGVVAAKVTADGRRLHRLAITDDLTGLYNLRGFEAQLPALVGASRRSTAPLSLLVLDVDRLKSLNDTHGHLTGSDAVHVIGRILAVHVPATAVACRFGGDEFVVAVPGCGASQAIELADCLRVAVQASAPVLAGARFPATTLSISIGLACLPPSQGQAIAIGSDAEAGETLFRAADRALYLAKTAGRNRVGAA